MSENEAADQAAHNAPAGCSKHNSLVHDFFISYRVDQSTQSKLASDLQKTLENVGDRLFAAGLRVYLDKLCIKDAARWEDEFLTGLKGSTAVILLLTQRSWNILINHLKNGVADNVLKEIQLALQLEKIIIPVCVKDENETSYFSFDNQDLTILEREEFAELKQAVHGIRCRQMIQIDLKSFPQSIFCILNAAFPAQVSEASMASVPAPSSSFSTNDDHMRAIATNLASTGYCIVSGIGGVGKSTTVQLFTQIAMATLASGPTSSHSIFESPFYDHVYWINCSSHHSALNSFQDIFSSTSDDETLAALSDLLMKKGRFLMVLDSADDTSVLESIFGELSFDQLIGGDFIVTTRLEEIPEGSFLSLLMDRSEDRSQRILDVTVWDIDKTRSYVLQCCPDLQATSAAVLDSLLETVGGFPIVIAQLVAYYNHCKPSISELEAALKVIFTEGGDTKTASLSELVKLSIKKMETSDVGTLAIFAYGCMGLVDGAKMQFKLLEALIEEICKERSLPVEDFDALEVLDLLKSSGILRQISGDGIYSVHKLHQEIINTESSKITSCNLSTVFSTTCEAILTVMTPNGLYSKEQCSMSSHVEHVDQFGSRLKWTKKLFALKTMNAQLQMFFSRYQSGYHKLKEVIAKAEEVFETKEDPTVMWAIKYLARAASNLGYFDEADKTFQTVLDVETKRTGSRDTKSVASVLNEMGLNLQSQGKFDSALKCFQEASDIYIKVHGTKVHTDVASLLSNMGLVAQSTSNYELAMQYYQESLDVQESLLGTRTHVAIATILNNMGLTASSLGKYQEAFGFYEEAMNIQKEVFGTSVHLNIAHSLSNIGLALNSLEKYQEALEKFQESLDIKGQLLQSKDHASVAITQNLMGLSFAGLGQHDKALQYHQESYSILVRLFPTKEHPDIALALGNMAKAQMSLGRSKEALTHSRESLAILEKVHGTRKTAEVATILNNIGLIESSEGHFAEAFTAFQETLEIQTEVFGTRQHPSIVVTLRNMALLAVNKGDFTEAIKLFKECLPIQTAVLGTRNHANVALTLNDLGFVYTALQQFADAKECYVEAMDIYKEVFDSLDYEEVAVLLKNFGILASIQGDNDEARKHYQESLDIFVKVLGSKNNINALNVLSSLGSITQQQGNFGEALKYFEETLDVLTNLFGTRERIDVANTLNNIGLAASNQGDLGKAIECFQESVDIRVKILGTKEDENVATILFNIANASLDCENFDQAVLYSTEALEISKRVSPDSTWIQVMEDFIVKAKEMQATKNT
ncbi:hypothetical protein DFJ73DRAFT_129515 [Zopfochytrium polystomum]|nr:hypothetical protein DFJ73DRAFT_129515 [Zopfochytrium polystomum]